MRRKRRSWRRILPTDPNQIKLEETRRRSRGRWRVKVRGELVVERRARIFFFLLLPPWQKNWFWIKPERLGEEEPEPSRVCRSTSGQVGKSGESERMLLQWSTNSPYILYRLYCIILLYSFKINYRSIILYVVDYQ